jgi:hypothetical protein
MPALLGGLKTGDWASDYDIYVSSRPPSLRKDCDGAAAFQIELARSCVIELAQSFVIALDSAASLPEGSLLIDTDLIANPGEVVTIDHKLANSIQRTEECHGLYSSE